jgi:hypothetical protein
MTALVDTAGPEQIRTGFADAAATISGQACQVAGLATGLGDAADWYETLGMAASTVSPLRAAATALTGSHTRLQAAGEHLQAAIADFDARDGRVADAVTATGNLMEPGDTTVLGLGTGRRPVAASAQHSGDRQEAAVVEPGTDETVDSGLAGLVAAITPDTPRVRLRGGESSETSLITLPDGRRVVHKRGHDDVGGPEWVQRQADAEILTGQVAVVVGARVAEVLPDPDDPGAIYVEFVDGPAAAANPYGHGAAAGQDGFALADELNGHPDAVRLGLLDALVGNGDRQAILTPDGPVGIDHEQAMWDLPGSDGQPAAAFVDTETGFKPGPIPREDLEALQPALEALRPAFTDRGRGDWHDYLMAAHTKLCDRAVPASRPPLTEAPLHGDDALHAPVLDLDAMTAAGDPRAEALWFRSGDNSLTSGYNDLGCTVLNKHLRDPDRELRHRPHLDQVAADIDAAMADSVLDRPITVYRGMAAYGLVDAEPGQWAGRAFHDPAPTSVSTDPAVAATYGTVMTVLVPPGIGAIRIGDRPDDDVAGKEILLQGGLTFQVVDEQVTRDDRGRLVRHDLVVEAVVPRPRPRPEGA